MIENMLNFFEALASVLHQFRPLCLFSKPLKTPGAMALVALPLTQPLLQSIF